MGVGAKGGGGQWPCPLMHSCAQSAAITLLGNPMGPAPGRLTGDGRHFKHTLLHHYRHALLLPEHLCAPHLRHANTQAKAGAVARQAGLTGSGFGTEGCAALDAAM